ncbi:hypothetical protein Tco_1121139 [Tanacetum coccineum]|uniref:Uncharacterized protein n=1 Tax=Tanacetum coccineum TaxID=301880 RepID=A0ABQ5J0I1_9ASTR
MITVQSTTDTAAGPHRGRNLILNSVKGKQLEMADTQAENHSHQGLPRHIFTTSIKQALQRDLDNVEMLMQGSVGLFNKEEDLVYSLHTHTHPSTNSSDEHQVCQQPSGLLGQSTSIVDPLAYVAHTTSAPALSSPSTPSPQPTAQSPNDALMATMTQIANLLSGFQKQFPPTNNQLRTSLQLKDSCYGACGHIVY